MSFEFPLQPDRRLEFGLFLVANRNSPCFHAFRKSWKLENLIRGKWLNLTQRRRYGEDGPLLGLSIFLNSEEETTVTVQGGQSYPISPTGSLDGREKYALIYSMMFDKL